MADSRAWEGVAMTAAVVVAGGRGVRMGLDLPKQFAEVLAKPILVYTLESLERQPEIEKYLVVVRAEYRDLVLDYAQKYGLSKFAGTTMAGSTCQESIRNGVYAFQGELGADDLLLVTDAIRPYVAAEVYSDVIEKARLYGNGITSLPYNCQICYIDDEVSAIRHLDRKTVKRIASPQCYRYGKLLELYQKAYSDGIAISGDDYANSLYTAYGERIYFAKGSEKNIKLTTPEDMEIFRAFLQAGITR